MINAPKITLILERFSDVSDGGAGRTRVWSQIRKCRGVMTYGRATERDSVGREVVKSTHQFWCPYLTGNLEITEIDRFRRIGKMNATRFYDIIYVDPLLDQRRWLKIDLLEVK